MNETDVRETIVRPLLERLGYKHGAESTIRTEQTFRYSKAFLGRKNPKKDPDLVGRADYILEVTSVGRWVTEVKSPSEELTRDVVEQAHTYAAHPEVAALFFMITNGRKFAVYRTSSLDNSVMAWDWEDTEEIFLALSNLLGPEAIKRKLKVFEVDKGKPLAPGLGSNVKITGGFVRYEDHQSNHPLLSLEEMNGLELPITGGCVTRTEDSRLCAMVKVAQSAPMMRELSELLDREDGYEFYSSDEYFSTNNERPSILQNYIRNTVPAGTLISIPVIGKISIPFGFEIAAFTEAIGFIDNGVFSGTMQLTYEFEFHGIPPMVRMQLEAQFGRFPQRASASGGGVFEVHLLMS